jgi:hypothetical protein
MSGSSSHFHGYNEAEASSSRDQPPRPRVEDDVEDTEDALQSVDQLDDPLDDPLPETSVLSND